MTIMGYPQKLLSDGESIVFEMRPHWRALLVPGLVLLAVILGMVLLWDWFGGWFEGDGILSGISQTALVLVALFLAAVFVVRPFLYWVTTQYVFTTRRVIVRSGLVSRHGIDMPLIKVNNVSFDVSVMGRLLNYGTLSISSASDEALIIEGVPDVEFVQREVNRLHDEDLARRRAQGSGESEGDLA